MSNKTIKSIKDMLDFINSNSSNDSRVIQHFKNKDSGGLRCKLDEKQKEILEESSLYYMIVDGGKRKMLFLEALLIGSIRPRFNFMKKICKSNK